MDNLAEWEAWRDQWDLRPGVTYLNHGSFGPPPKAVQRARQHWQAELDRNPMDFFVRHYEPAWFAARQTLAKFVGAAAQNLVFADNATSAMNVVAHSFPLRAGDEVLLNDHEYGAVLRIWQRATQSVGATVRFARLPLPVQSTEQVVEALFAATTPRTRLIVVSHITSPTAITLPVASLCAQARRCDIAVCVDGPHAVAQLPLELEQLGCDFYCASCHKWLSAPFGSGFLYVAPRHHSSVRPPQLSWGRLLPQQVEQWSDEFIWSGTRDPAAYLAVPAAIEFLEAIGLEKFRARLHALARYARQQLVELFGLPPSVPDAPEWYCGMAHVPLPPQTPADLQQGLWQRYQIEVPIVTWNERRWIRVSCHLYNRHADIDLLIRALRETVGPVLP
ncbi:MAG: aminotransferase class V-fold PLP-dependent enzyme [Planctomycetota bacterium]|nr:aminotransferase class V-fold PLP-dependent enzyme [Planctomycetota bacterium]